MTVAVLFFVELQWFEQSYHRHATFVFQSFHFSLIFKKSAKIKKYGIDSKIPGQKKSTASAVLYAKSQKLFNIRFLETEVLFLIDSLQNDTENEGGDA